MIHDYSTYKIDYLRGKIKKHSLKSPFGVVVIGATGVGKSTTLNSVLKRNRAKVGNTCNPETMEIGSYALNPYITIYDTPGLGDSPENDKRHMGKILNLLRKKESSSFATIDLCLVIVEPKKDIGTPVKLIESLLKEKNLEKRIVIAINQADLVLGGFHWNHKTNSPDSKLKEKLKQLSVSMQSRIQRDTGIKIIRPICYSAFCNWNLTSVVKCLIKNIPNENRLI